MYMFSCICDIYNNHSIVLCMSNSDVINSHPSYHCFRNCIELSITCIEENILFLIPQFIPNSTSYDTRNCDRNSMIGFLKRFDICKGVDRFSRFKREEKDMKYNIQFYKRYKYYTSIMSNADFIFNNKTGLIELK